MPESVLSLEHTLEIQSSNQIKLLSSHVVKTKSIKRAHAHTSTQELGNISFSHISDVFFNVFFYTH